MNRNKFVISTVIFLVLIGHFVFSTVVQPVGPALYIGVVKTFKEPMLLHCDQEIACSNMHCPLMILDDYRDRVKGFPLQYATASTPCEEGAYSYLGLKVSEVSSIVPWIVDGGYFGLLIVTYAWIVARYRRGGQGSSSVISPNLARKKRG
jgi:hypothetical protein